MSNMSELAAELQEAQEQAWDAAMILEQKLGAISEILWQGDDMATNKNRNRSRYSANGGKINCTVV